VITANVDGGARGNPGPAGYGAVITDDNGQVLA
jgi:probable phosphoglycerate mutase